jgi:hypothetical protein
MQRRRRASTLAAVLALLLIAAPANAGPPQRVEVADHLSALVSFQDEAVIFWNTTAATFCNWLEQGGPAPTIVPVPWQFKETGQGATVASARGDAPVELWRFEGTPGSRRGHAGGRRRAHRLRPAGTRGRRAPAGGRPDPP